MPIDPGPQDSGPVEPSSAGAGERQRVRALLARYDAGHVALPAAVVEGLRAALDGGPAEVARPSSAPSPGEVQVAVLALLPAGATVDDVREICVSDFGPGDGLVTGHVARAVGRDGAILAEYRWAATSPDGRADGDRLVATRRRQRWAQGRRGLVAQIWAPAPRRGTGRQARRSIRTRRRSTCAAKRDGPPEPPPPPASGAGADDDLALEALR